jgi:hypothetical protein
VNRLTVKQLIELLKKFDGEQFVSVEKDNIDYTIDKVVKDVLGDISIKI